MNQKLLLMHPRNRAINTGKSQFWLSLGNHVRHDLVPDAAKNVQRRNRRPGVVPVAKLGRDRAPFGTIVEPLNDGLDGAPLLFARAGPAQFHRRNRRFELSPLVIGQHLHGLTPAKGAERSDFPQFAKSSIANRP